MFKTKQSNLIEKKDGNASKKENAFVKAGKEKSRSIRRANIATVSGNGAAKITTTDDVFVDQFASAGNYKKPREYDIVAADMEKIWKNDPLKAIKLSFYFRMITRTTALIDGSKTETLQRGQGLKNEGIMRMLWIAINHPDDFWNNFHILVAIGSWKDIFQMLSLDLQFHRWEGRVLDWEKMGQVIVAGLKNENTLNLVKKYLPQIKANSKCNTLPAQANTIIAKWVCSIILGVKEQDDWRNYRRYRKFKNSGNAHEWQKLISQKRFSKIDFGSVHGRALAILVSGKFLKNSKLEAKYADWIEAQPVAKYTGYAYELMEPLAGIKPLKSYQEMTMNKQFMGLVEKAKKGIEDSSSFLCVVDVSASMSSQAHGTKVPSIHIALCTALYFSYMLKGPFAEHFMKFSNDAELIEWKGNTPIERIRNIRIKGAGNTDLQAVTQLLIDIKAKNIPESDFPTGLLCISDGEFDGTGNGEGEVSKMRKRLLAMDFSKKYVDNLKVVLWDIPNTFYGRDPGTKSVFEDFADTPNLFHISGLDPAVVSFILGGGKNDKKAPVNSEELLEAALDQEILNLIKRT